LKTVYLSVWIWVVLIMTILMSTMVNYKVSILPAIGMIYQIVTVMSPPVSIGRLIAIIIVLANPV
jgi:hypothetical protein